MSVFRRWLEGEADYPLLDGWREAPPKTKKPAPKKRDDRKELRGFLRVYAVCAVLLCAVLILGFLFLTGPALTHLIAGAEVSSHPGAGKDYREEDRR